MSELPQAKECASGRCTSRGGGQICNRREEVVPGRRLTDA
jgi:hypothetical protein